MNVKREEKMKRLFVVMIAAIAAGLLAGCYFPDYVPDKEQGNSSAYGEKDVYGLNETAVFSIKKDFSHLRGKSFDHILPDYFTISP